jgi:asparagine synthase (glutamine-hydrolysing)
MQRQADRPVKTFTIGFDKREFDEAQHARAIAAHLGTDHTALNLSGEDALALIPRLPAMFDEPHADPSQIPTFLVSELARKQVTVALTGDGGDELFGGYNRYVLGERVIPGFQRYPMLLRRFSAAGVRTISPRAWDQVGDFFRPAFPVGPATRLLGERLYKVAELLRGGSSATMYRSLLSAWQDPQSLVVGGRESASPRTIRSDRLGLIDEMMLWDQQSYLADDLLAKVDRASMAVGLEARVPILDHRVVEFAWRLDRRHKVRDGRGKWILRQVLYKHVPRGLVDREKMGFSVPLAHWLTGPLRNWAGDMLESASRGSVLQQKFVSREWNAFLRGRSSNAAGIWALVMFCAWQDQWMGSARADIPRAVAS